MPKIPLDFSKGLYVDNDPSIENRLMVNCYPETIPGSTDKTIIRFSEGFDSTELLVGSAPNNCLLVTNVPTGTITTELFYYVSGNKVYKGSTELVTLPTTDQVFMVSNGLNVVIGGVGLNYLIAIDTIDNSITDIYQSDKGRVIDGAFMDGRYIFITESNIYHGSLLTENKGLNFNPLSFAALPERGGRGLAVSNSVLYAFTKFKTFIYQTAPTTPFSLSRSTGQDIQVGLLVPTAKTVIDDEIFFHGSTQTSYDDIYMISGTSFKSIGNPEVRFLLSSESSFSSRLSQLSTIFSAYKVREHQFLMIAPSIVDARGSAPGTIFIYDKTESDLRGYPVWHLKRASEVPLLKAFRPRGFGRNSIFGARGDSGDLTQRAAVYGIDENRSFDPSIFALSATENAMATIELPAISESADPLFIKKIKAHFSSNVGSASLSIDEPFSSSSLGTFDLTSLYTKVCEWRRIGRIHDRFNLRVRFSPVSGDRSCALIEGYIEV